MKLRFLLEKVLLWIKPEIMKNSRRSGLQIFKIFILGKTGFVKFIIF